MQSIYTRYEFITLLSCCVEAYDVPADGGVDSKTGYGFGKGVQAALALQVIMVLGLLSAWSRGVTGG